jgi:hypothetical protein
VHLFKVISNNEYLEALTSAQSWVYELGNFTKAVPEICFKEYLIRKRIGGDLVSGLAQDISVAYFNSEDRNETETETELSALLGDDFLSDEMFLMNVTELYSFMPTCGNAAEPLARQFLNDARNALNEIEGSLSFNWIACFPGASSQHFVSHYVDELRYEAQHDYYESVWDADQERLYQQYLEEPVLTTVPTAVATLRAYERSLHDATGEKGTIVLSSCFGCRYH